MGRESHGRIGAHPIFLHRSVLLVKFDCLQEMASQERQLCKRVLILSGAAHMPKKIVQRACPNIHTLESFFSQEGIAA